jgi:hypothetical protein
MQKEVGIRNKEYKKKERKEESINGVSPCCENAVFSVYE